MGTEGGHAGAYGVRIVGFVGQHVACAFSGRKQFRCASAIGLLTGAEHHVQRVAQRVDEGVDFGRQPTTAAPEGFVADAAFFGYRPIQQLGETAMNCYRMRQLEAAGTILPPSAS